MRTYFDFNVLSSLVRFSVPIVFVSVLQAGYQLIDAFWVGRLGENAVAAVSITFPVLFLLMALGLGMSLAGSTLVAQYRGAGNSKLVNHVTAQTLLAFAAASVVLTIVGYVAAPHILSAMGAGSAIYADALVFMRISILGMSFLFAFIMFQAIMRGIGHPGPALAIVAGTVFLNFLLDPLFIYGYGPIPGYGVAGAAAATFVTQAISAVAGFALLFSGKYGIRLRRADLVPDFAILTRMLRLGVPASVEQSSRAIGFGLMTTLVASFGTHSLAAYGIGSNLMQFIVIPAVGLSMATAALVGQNIWAGRLDMAVKLGRASALLGTASLTVAAGILYAFAPFFVAFFLSGDPEAERTAIEFVRVLAICFPFMGLQFALFGVLRGAGDAAATMILTISQYVVLFPVAYFLARHGGYGIDGVWWAFPISTVIAASLSTAWYLRGSWKTRRLTDDGRLSERVTEEAIIEEYPKGA